MSDSKETVRDADRKQPEPLRRPWHAPQFITTDLATTDVVGNGGRDGGPMGSAS